MANFTTLIGTGPSLTITIEGRFDYNSIPEFRELYESSDINPTTYIIDFQKTENIDSSALGMLLMMRRHANAVNAKIVLKNLNADMKRIFAVSKLDTLFDIQ